MTDIIWKEPPPAPQHVLGRRFGGKGYEFTEALKANPGHWAYYGAYKSARSAYQLAEQYGVQTTNRKREDGLWDVYARWPEDGKPWNSATEEP